MASGSLVTVLSDSSFTDQVVDVAAFVSRSKPEGERSEYINSWSARATEAESSQQQDEITKGLVGEVKTLGAGNERGEYKRASRSVHLSMHPFA